MKKKKSNKLLPFGIALAVVLIFIGSKIFLADAMGWEKFPPAWSLGVTLAILAVGVGVSLAKTRGQDADASRHGG